MSAGKIKAEGVGSECGYSLADVGAGKIRAEGVGGQRGYIMSE